MCIIVNKRQSRHVSHFPILRKYLFCNHPFPTWIIYLVSVWFLSVQAQMTLKHAQAELKTKQAEVKKMDSGYKKDQDNLQAVRSSREKLEAELAKLNYEGTLLLCVQVKSQVLMTFCQTFCNNMCVCMQMGRRKVCWIKDGSCPERSLNLKRPMRVLCHVSPTCALTTSKDLLN